MLQKTIYKYILFFDVSFFKYFWLLHHECSRNSHFRQNGQKTQNFLPANVCINKEEHIYCHYQYSGLAPSGRRVKKIVKYYSFCNKRAKHLISSDYLGGP